MALQQQRIEIQLKNFKDEHLEQSSLRKQTDWLQNVYDNRQILTKHEMYVVELLCELIRQLRGKSPFDFVTGIFSPSDINTRRRRINFICRAEKLFLRTFGDFYFIFSLRYGLFIVNK